MTFNPDKFDAWLISKGIESKARRVAFIRAVKKLHSKLHVKADPSQISAVCKAEFPFNHVTASIEAWNQFSLFSHETREEDDSMWRGRNLRRAAIFVANTEEELFALTQLRKASCLTFQEAMDLKASACAFGKLLPTGEARFVQVSLPAPSRMIRVSKLDASHLYAVVMRAISTAGEARAVNMIDDAFVFDETTLKAVDPTVFRPSDVMDVIMPPMPPHLVSLEVAPESLQLLRYLKGEK